LKALVTGGAGFIGSNLSEKLVELGHEVRVIDNFSTGKRDNLIGILNDVEIVEGDVRDYRSVESAMTSIEVVFHLAAVPSVPRSIKDPITSNDVNVGGTLNVLMAAKKSGVRRVVFASSSSVYGDSPTLPKSEDMTPRPMSPYAVSKLAGEEYSRVFSELYGLETISLRYFNVFGPRQDPGSEYSAVIPKFIKAMLSCQRPIIYGDGQQSRDFTYIDNVVEANVLAASADCEPGLVMNCAAQSRTTLNELVSSINMLLGKDIKPVYAHPRRGDIRHSFADISLIRRILGYEPKISFDIGLKKTIDFFRAAKDQPAEKGGH